MDDDDYYFPTRVEHAVQMLSKSKNLIAGCSEKYMFSYELNKLFENKLEKPLKLNKYEQDINNNWGPGNDTGNRILNPKDINIFKIQYE